MGYYIETDSASGKAAYLREVFGAQYESGPYFDRSGKRVGICVVNNGPFEAAGIVFSDGEKEAFSLPDDPRPKIWLSLDRATTIKLCPKVEKHLPEQSLIS